MKKNNFISLKSDDAQKITCHCEGAAHGVIVDDYRLNAPCHCEERSDEAIHFMHDDNTHEMDCHAAPSAPLAMTCGEKRKAAFTLAETLITLMVIGVVAALTIPALMQNINERALLKQRQTVAAKIAEGFANMRVAGDLETKYNSTAEFVEAMKKYFQISAVCNSNNLSACFAETVTTTNEGEEVVNTVSEMADVDKVIGLKLADGTSMLIKYNTDVEGIAEGRTEVGKASIKDGEVSPATFDGLFEYKFDVNGSKAPNAQGKDMLGDLVIEKGGDPYGLGFEIINNTVYTPGTYCPACIAYKDDFWIPAMNYCTSLGGSLPDESQLKTIAAKLYPCTEGSDEYGIIAYYCSPDTTNELWSVVGNADLWSDTPDGGGYACYKYYYDGLDYEDGFSGNGNEVYGISAVCVK